MDQSNYFQLSSSSVKLFCNSCRRKTNHKSMRDPLEEFKEEERITWHIVQCAGCDGTSFYKETSVDNADSREITGQDVYLIREDQLLRYNLNLLKDLDTRHKSLLHCSTGSSIPVPMLEMSF